MNIWILNHYAIPPDSPGGTRHFDFAKAVEYLIEHPDEARKMGENGRKAVVEKYNWETESKKLIAVYEDLLKGR